MSAAGLYRALGLGGYRVLDSWQSDADGRVRVLVEAPRHALRCRACGCSRVHVHERAVRSWESAPLELTPVDIVMRSPRVKCLGCGAKTWHQPTFANGQRRITKTFEGFIERQLTRLTIQDVVEMYGLSWNTVCEIDLARLKKLTRPKLGGLKRLAIDENYLGARHGFVTIVLDLDTKAIVSVLKGRGKAALKPFFAKLKQARAQVKAVATDMAGGYIAAVMEYLPKAALVFDPVLILLRHVVKLMNEKLSDLRRAMYHELTDKQHRKVLKGTRWLLVMNPENLKQNAKVDEKAQLQEALKLNESLSVAYYLKEDLRQFWNQKSKPAAEKFLEAWCRRADASGIRQMQTMAKTLRGHRTGLLNWYDHPISTGPLEGINNKIGALQRRAYGYRNYEHLKERLLTLHHTKYTLRG
jgi:transposase